jgi:hypothetical protein
MPADKKTCMRICTLRFDGDLVPLIEPRCRIEFIGDSFTSAEGSLASFVDTEWRPIWFSAAKSFGMTAARLLGGEARFYSQSGWGIRSSWDNDPRGNLPAYYEEVCGVLPTDAKGACHVPYDFASWKADVVVCAAGLNDEGAMRAELPGKDSVTGAPFKQRREDLPLLEDAILAFLRQIRRCNPNSWILYTMIQPFAFAKPAVLGAIERFCAAGEGKIDVIYLPSTQKGARDHLSIEEHLEVGLGLAHKIGSILKLDLVSQPWLGRSNIVE